MQRQVAADAAVRANGVDLGLLFLVPGARLAQLELARGHERARGAHGDAVAAVHARRFRQRHVELGGDVRTEAAAGGSRWESTGKPVTRILIALIHLYQRYSRLTPPEQG